MEREGRNCTCTWRRTSLRRRGGRTWCGCCTGGGGVDVALTVDDLSMNVKVW
ncbi:hypothetical protein U1Q18_015846, partial [Sarracenia purpurea var. burkii]